MSTVADYNNNPGNLKPVGFTYKDQIGVDDRGFAVFANKEAGRNALIQDIQIKQKKGINTPQSFIDKYAPAGSENSEESRDNYKVGMAGHLGLKNTNAPFPDGSAEKIADFITSFERGSQTTQEAPKADPNNPFAVGVPLADKARQASITEGTTESTTPEAKEVIDPLTTAGVAAAASLPNMYPAQEAEKLQKAKDAVELSRLNLEKTLPKNRSYESLSEEFKNRQQVFETAKNEFDLAKKIATTPPTPAAIVTNAPQTVFAPSTPQIITDPNFPTMDQQTRGIQGTTEDGMTGRARQTTYLERTSQVARNAAKADKTLSALEGQGLIDKDKALALTEGISGSTPSGVKVSPDLEGEIKNKAELEKRIADDKIEQKRLSQQIAGERFREANQAMKDAKPAQTAVTKAESAQEIAQRQLSRARGVPSLSRAAVGGIGGLQAARGLNELANMPIEELIKRYQAGDRSPELFAAIQQVAGAGAQTGFGAAATVPVVGARTAKIKGAGALGTLGMGLYEGYKAYNEPNKVAP